MASETPRASGPTVLMTADAVGGVWTYAMELCRALCGRGIRVVLCTMGERPSDAQREQAGQIPSLELRESAYRLEWMDDPWDDVARAGEWLLEVEREVCADVVHLNGYAHASLPFRAPVMVVAHSCVLSWFRAVKGEEAPQRYGRYRELVTRGVRAAASVVAPSSAYLGEVADLYGPLRRSRVIHNARTLPPPRWVQKEPFVFCAARLWDEAKNVSQLAKVGRALKWPVRIAGDARTPDGGERSFGVEYLGRLAPEEVSEQMWRAAIYALPARYEPFGLSALEAAQRGCALVLGDIPTLREVWGEAALYVPPHDERALAEALEALTSDPVLRVRMADRAWEQSRRYGPEPMVRAYLDEYQRLRAATPAPQYATR